MASMLAASRRRLAAVLALLPRCAAELSIPREDGGSVVSDDEDSNGEFEFPSESQMPAAGGGAAADELFAGSRIRTLYPMFRADLLRRVHVLHLVILVRGPQEPQSRVVRLQHHDGHLMPDVRHVHRRAEAPLRDGLACKMIPRGAARGEAREAELVAA